MKYFKKLIPFICIILSIVFTVSAANQKDLNNVIDKKNQLQKDITNSKQQKKNAEADLNAIEERMKIIQGEINEINGRLDTLEGQKTKITAELDEAVAKEQKQEKTLKKRLRVMYEDGATSYFKVLLSSESIFDFFYNLERLSQITEHDDKILTELAENKKIIEKKKSDLETVIAQVETEKAAQVSKKSVLQAESDKKVAYMKQLESDIAAYTKNYEKMEAEEARIRSEIAAAANASSSSGQVPAKYSGGAFQWPTPGYYTVTSPYGYRIHPIFKTQKLHRGIDIAVPSGVAVLAAADGVVIKSTYNSSYGYYVSINHGGGLVTLYAHNSSLAVSVGQSVKRGQKIANSGNTGNSTGPHLHYEVMVNGQTTNPMNYHKNIPERKNKSWKITNSIIYRTKTQITKQTKKKEQATEKNYAILRLVRHFSLQATVPHIFIWILFSVLFP